MSIKIALAGNPNSGKTTLFNHLTGSRQHVGNWPGVTVEKKEGTLKSNKEVTIQDLPGIYSLSPYSLEEVVARNYLVHERPDAILNIVDATNIERNLYLTTQLLELGIPVVVALNMMDLVERNGDQINVDQLSKLLGCKVVTISALKGTNTLEAANQAALAAKAGEATAAPSIFYGDVKKSLDAISDLLKGKTDAKTIPFLSVKLFERDEKINELVTISESDQEQIETIVNACEQKADDDAESIITAQRYEYLTQINS